jgi:hypothetical protein
MKYIIMSLFLLITQLNSLAFGQTNSHIDSHKVTKIALEMSQIGPECQFLPSEAMQARRLDFLKNNKDATISELVRAIDKPIDGQDIRTRLRSFNRDVCDEYAASIDSDYQRGLTAGYFDWITVETLLARGLLEYSKKSA